MRSRRRSLLLVGICLACSVACGWMRDTRETYKSSESVATTKTDGVRVAAVGQCLEGNCTLTFLITNRTPRAIIIPARFLPWGENAVNWGVTPVLALEALDRRQKSLARLHPVSDIGSDALATIAPGQSARGTVLLNSYFLSVPQKASEGTIRVRWRYRLLGLGDGREILFWGE